MAIRHPQIFPTRWPTLLASARLQKTYTPVNVVSVIRFDEARAQGRRALRKRNEGGSKS
jgi:hypothetical protein